MKNSLRSLAVSTTALVAMALGLSAADPANFKPDGSFKGSTLTGWRVLGDAEWTASNGELIGKAKPGTNGGWLVMDKSFQDVQLYMNYKCTGECKSGVLLRGQKTPDGGMKGVYVSMSDGDTASYAVTLDATGKETGRTQLNRRLAAAAPALRLRPAAPVAPAPVRRAPARGARARSAPSSAAAPPPAPARGTQVGSRRPRPADAQSGRVERDLHRHRHGRTARPAARSARSRSSRPTARRSRRGRREERGRLRRRRALRRRHRRGALQGLRLEGLMSIVEPKEQVSPRFTMQQVTTVYYGWGATTGDINKDGNLDLVSGPFYYAGPDFTERRRYRDGYIYNPENQFAPDMVNLASDFTGDGCVDILSSLGNRHMDLYVNPKGESRRWDKFSVLPTISSEIVLLKDLDKDGKPEVIFGQGAANGYGVGEAGPGRIRPRSGRRAGSRSPARR